ncbi:MAG: ribosome biogenesis GTPase YlqF [Metamycoplasmataceae bacterium]
MLNINWYPGHMAKAIKDIKEKKDLIDCFIIVLDARVPLSTYNEEFDKIAPNKPRLFVLSKKELSVDKEIENVKQKFDDEKDDFIALNLKDSKSKKDIIQKLKKILKKKIERDKRRGLLSSNLKCFVVGLPNVGKSTLINLVASNNSKVKVENHPGTTKALKWIQIENIFLLDSPGIMMPKIKSDEQALKLVACNLIRKEVISDYEFITKIQDILIEKKESFFSENDLEYFSKENDKYSELIRYGKNKNILKKNGEVDKEKVYSLIRKKIIDIKKIYWD